MLRLISDQNFSGPILRGMYRRIHRLDAVRALDVGLDKALDPFLLDSAASNDRILLTHDVNTIAGFAYDRVRAGFGMPESFSWISRWPSAAPSGSQDIHAKLPARSRRAASRVVVQAE